MLFQTLDDKNECVGIYYDGDLYFNDELPEGISETWAYAPFLSNRVSTAAASLLMMFVPPI